MPARCSSAKVALIRIQFVVVGESPSWLRHRILIPTCEGSNPSSPAKCIDSRLPFSAVGAAKAGADSEGRSLRPQSLDGGNVLFNTLLFTGNANPALAQEIATHL